MLIASSSDGLCQPMRVLSHYTVAEMEVHTSQRKDTPAVGSISPPCQSERGFRLIDRWSMLLASDMNSLVCVSVHAFVCIFFVCVTVCM